MFVGQGMGGPVYEMGAWPATFEVWWGVPLYSVMSGKQPCDPVSYSHATVTKDTLGGLELSPLVGSPSPKAFGLSVPSGIGCLAQAPWGLRRDE